MVPFFSIGGVECDWHTVSSTRLILMDCFCADHPNRPCSTPVGDKPGHLYAIDQINCTAIKG